jgi:hypothetical protein
LTERGERTYRAIAAAARRRNGNLLAGLGPGAGIKVERALAELQARASHLLARPDLGFGPVRRKRRT